jgi:arsenical pump membrane protein
VNPGAVVGIATFAAVVVASITRPRGFPEWAAAIAGAGVVLALGLVGPADAARAVAADWNVLLFFLGMTGMAAVAERSGFFEYSGRLALRLADRSGRRLLLAILGIGTAISVFLSNDATALVLTPVVYTLVVGIGLDALPYVLACTFIADAASLVLPVSNPVNLLVLDGTGVSLSGYLVAVMPAAIVTAALTILAVAWFFRGDVPARLPARIPVDDRTPVRRVWLGLAAIAIAFVSGSLLGVPLGLVACAGFGALLVLETTAAGRLYARPLEGVSWPILGYVGGMVVMVAALEQQGVVQALVGQALDAVRSSPKLTAAVASVLAAAGSNLVNNVPMTLVMVNAINTQHLAGPARDAAAYGTIVGADLGPNLTPVGSLATVLWLLILRERGLDVRPIDYLRFGLLTTPPILLIATLLVALPR